MRTVAGCLLLAACGSELPPYAELPLRDTLQADPRAVSMLTPAARTQLLQRFTDALAEQPARRTLLEESALDAQVVEHDVSAERDGRDADLIVQLTPDGLHTRGNALQFALPENARSSIGFDRDLAQALPETRAIEASALSGRAGALIGIVAQARGARLIARVAGWPAAITVAGDTAYVNAAWLVAMADSAPSVIVPSVAQAISVPAVNDIPTCEAQVSAACSAGGDLGDAVLTTDFSSGSDECAAAVTSSGSYTPTAQYMCMALALQRPEIAGCIKRNEPGCLQGDTKSVAFWSSFEAKAACANTFTGCMLSPSYREQISCNACTQSCGCSPTYSSPSCTTPSCNGTNCNPGSCNTGSCSCGNNKICSALPPEPPSLGVLWALLPLAYFLRAARRRSA